MTTTHQQRDEASKQAARLRSLADQVVEPTVAGRKYRKALTHEKRKQWNAASCICCWSNSSATATDSKALAKTWQSECKAVGIGVGWFSWLFWNWAFPLLLELAKLWIESNKNQEQTGDR